MWCVAFGECFKDLHKSLGVVQSTETDVELKDLVERKLLSTFKITYLTSLCVQANQTDLLLWQKKKKK